jgi:hypothetical protein
MKQNFVGEEHPQSFINWSRVEQRHCNGEEPDVNTVDLLIVLEPIASGTSCNAYARGELQLSDSIVLLLAAEEVPFKMVDAEVSSVRLVVSEFEDSYAINKIVTQKVKACYRAVVVAPFIRSWQRKLIATASSAADFARIVPRAGAVRNRRR